MPKKYPMLEYYEPMTLCLKYIVQPNYHLKPRIPPAMMDRSNNIIKMKKMILAIPTAPAAMPPKPKIPATRAITNNTKINRNMILNFKGEEKSYI